MTTWTPIDLFEADVECCGPKAGTLARLAAAGLPIPRGFVIPVGAYRDHIEAHDLASFISSRLTELRDRLPATAVTPAPEAALAEIRRALCSHPLDPALEDAIREHAARLDADGIAVRSSALAEDMPGFSFAGQHGTYYTSTTDQAIEHVQHCWASLWSDRAFEYRERMGFDHLSSEMAVIVQHLVPAGASGVAFTADPMSGEHRVIIESCLGLGEALVSGKVTPDRFTLSRPDLGILDASIAMKESEIVYVTGDRVNQHDNISDPPAGVASLSEADARRVARLALQAEEIIGSSVDVEWAREGTSIWVLQARPITTGPAEEEVLPSSGDVIWSNLNTGEILPDVITPMTWSVIVGHAQEITDGLFGDLGVSVDAYKLFGRVAGRVYFNLSLIREAFATVPSIGGTSVDDLLGGMQDYVELPEAPEGRSGDVSFSYGSFLVGAPRTLMWGLKHSPRRSASFRAHLRDIAESGIERSQGHPSEDAAGRAVDALIGEMSMITDALGYAGVAMVQYSNLAWVTRRWLGDDTGAIANALLAAQGGVASADAGLTLWDLSRLAALESAIATSIADGDSWPEVSSVAASRAGKGSQEARDFLDGWSTFMAEHGHHTRGEFEFANPRWSETPQYVLGMLRAYVVDEGAHDPRKGYAERAQKAAALEMECSSQLRPIRRALFRRTLRSARKGAVMRENTKSEGVRFIFAIRSTLLALGAALADENVLDAADDIFFLMWDELTDIRAGEIDARMIVAERRAEHERNRQLHPPPIVVGEWDAEDSPDFDYGAIAQELSGIPVASGVVRGRARVIRSVDSTETVGRGEILVAPFTDPGWTPYFVPAAGIVMDMGGLLSHGSIIAREYGMPAVVNVGPATTLIETGDLIEVDGDAGVVRIIERAGGAHDDSSEQV